MNIQEIVRKRGSSRTDLLQILHDLQDASGDNSLHRDDLEALAEVMGLTVADVLGTASFYSMFSFTPRGRHLVRLCESPPCYIMGEENVREAIRRKLGIDFGETTADRCFTLEATSCLGACGVAPVMMIDEEIYGNLTETKVAEILDRVARADQTAAAD